MRPFYDRLSPRAISYRRLCCPMVNALGVSQNLAASSAYALFPTGALIPPPVVAGVSMAVYAHAVHAVLARVALHGASAFALP